MAVIFTLALAFATVEIPRIINQTLTGYFIDYHPRYQPQIVESFTASVRPIGYALLAVVIALIIAVFVSKKIGIYLGILVLLSLPFLQINWPPALRWIDWPYLD